MKKQKFNGKLRLKKNVISNLNARQITGGGDTTFPTTVFPSEFCTTNTPTGCLEESNITCLSQECTLGCAPEETQHIDCHTQEASCPCR